MAKKIKHIYKIYTKILKREKQINKINRKKVTEQ